LRFNQKKGSINTQILNDQSGVMVCHQKPYNM
jgi:hypothetical protein